MSDVWTMVHAEREALIEDLEGIEDDGWETASWCAAWTAHDVVAHLAGSGVEALVRSR